MKFELKHPALLFIGALLFVELFALLFGFGAMLALNLCLAVAWSIRAKIKTRVRR